jgi:hypothetical protein
VDVDSLATGLPSEHLGFVCLNNFPGEEGKILTDKLGRFILFAGHIL